MPRRPPPPPLPAPDAAVVPPSPSARGESCAPGCAEGLFCAPLPGGYCASFCGVTGTPCDGACVETGRGGEVCAKSCTADRDCRVDEGYVCDPQWHGCIVPNIAAIVPQQCPLVGPARDAAFGPSEAWSSAATAGTYQFEPSAVVTDDGGVVALYSTRGATTDDNVLGVARQDGKGKLTLDARLGKADHRAFDPWLARDAKGKLYAVWYSFEGRDEHGEILLASSTDRGATWTESVAVHEPADCKPDEPGCLDKPMVAVGPGPRGKGEPVYVMYSADSLRVRASRDGGKTFGIPVTALAGIYGNSAIGSDGRLHLVSLDGGPLGAFGSAQQKVEYTVTADGGATFGKPITVSGPDEVIPFFFSNPSVVVDDRRRWTYVAYARGGRDARWDIVIAATKDAGKTWTRTTIGDGCAIHMVPNLALDPRTGALHVAYYDSDGAPGRFVHATCAIGAAKCVPGGAINSVPFGALSTVRHGAKWIGEYETLVIDDKRRVLHAVWTQPVAEDGKIVARIFHAAAKLK